MNDGFEIQQEIPDIPISLPVTPLSQIQEYYWYKENDNAILSIVTDYVHSGVYSCSCNATLDGLNHVKMIKSIFDNYVKGNRFMRK